MKVANMEGKKARINPIVWIRIRNIGIQLVFYTNILYIIIYLYIERVDYINIDMFTHIYTKFVYLHMCTHLGCPWTVPVITRDPKQTHLALSSLS